MRKLVMFAALVLPAIAHAGTVACSGTVEALSYHASSTGGTFMIRLSSMNAPVFFCDPDTSYSVAGVSNSVSPAACKALYATFLSAKVSGLPISNMYFDGDAVPTTCSGWASWQGAIIRHYIY